MKPRPLLGYFTLSAAVVYCALFLGGSTQRHDAGSPVEECTIGVACPAATKDGRPLLWKTRDTTTLDNEVYYNSSNPHRFIAVVDANGDSSSAAWMGVNEHGFAILNANSEDLAPGIDNENGEFMRDALGHCRSVAMFRAMLDSTNTSRKVHANFGVIDSTGAAFLFEASQDTYWVYDASEAPEGFIVRANFACNDTAGNGIDDCVGVERFLRSSELVSQLVAEDNLSCESLLDIQMRDFAEQDGTALPVPCFDCGDPDSLYGVINAKWSICRSMSVSAAIIHGVAADANPLEPAFLSTMWVLLGQPAATIASPFWPVGPAPAAANGDTTAPLCDRARLIRGGIFRFEQIHFVDSFRLRDGNGGGLWSAFLPVEADILDGTRLRLDLWRQEPPSWDAMLAVEDSLADLVLDLLWGPTASVADEDLVAHLAPVLGHNHPNPFNPRTTIVFELPVRTPVELGVYDLAGRLVRTLAAGAFYGSGRQEVVWDGRDTSGREAPSGVYVCRLVAGGVASTGKLVLVR